MRASLLEGKAKRLGGRTGDVLPLLARAVELSAELFDHEQSPKLADAQIALAECLLDLGQRDQAKALLAQANAIHASHKELGEHYRKPMRDLQARFALLH